MTTQAKLILCAGLLALAIGVAFVWRPRPSPEVELSFVRHTNGDGGVWAVLYLTNRGRYPIVVRDNSGRVVIAPMRNAPLWNSKEQFLPALLMNGAGMDLAVLTFDYPASLSVRWEPVRLDYVRTETPTNRRVELGKAGIITANTGGVATVQLPPR